MFEDKDNQIKDPTKADFVTLIRVFVVLVLLFPPVVYFLTHLLELALNKI